MKITFVHNACQIIEHQGYRLLCDPWLTPGAFEGSWFPRRPLRTTVALLGKIDGVYVSHLHPDHFDPVVLAQLPKTIDVIVHRGNGMLPMQMRELGFERVMAFPGSELTARVGPFDVTVFGPFQDHPFHDRQMPSDLDSALLLRAGKTSLFNANDNLLTVEAARRVRTTFGAPTMFQMAFNAAGPYPACFRNLSHDQKIAERDRILDRNLTNFARVADEMGAVLTMPFAGSYRLSGGLTHLNQYLAVVDELAFAARADPMVVNSTMLSLREGDTFDLEDFSFVSGYLGPADGWTDTKINWPEPDYRDLAEWLGTHMEAACTNFNEACIRARYRPDGVVIFNAGIAGVTSTLGVPEHGATACYLKPIHAARLLLGTSIWNHLEIGCYIEFDRLPNHYDPDLHVMLNQFKLPRSLLASATETFPRHLREAVGLSPAHEMA